MILSLHVWSLLLKAGLESCAKEHVGEVGIREVRQGERVEEENPQVQEEKWDPCVLIRHLGGILN